MSKGLAGEEFLAILSHELRAPLNGIKSWAHVLENALREPDPLVARAIAGIQVGVEHQVRLIERLLSVSGDPALDTMPVRLMPLIEDVTESLHALAAEKSLAIVTKCADPGLTIRADPVRVRQILVNLLDNSIKFTPAGGTVWISAAAQDAMACIKVRDNGAGIAPEFVPHVFEAFRQGVDGPASRHRVGLGLGLALVRRLAELQGGHATCESAGPGQGATFRVFLPLV